MRTAVRIATLTTALCITGAGLAAAQTGERQSIDFTFSNQRPGGGADVRLAIDYVNPEDSQAKPPAVAKVVETLAPGSRIDSSVPERCTASDAAITGQGAAACPAGSNVGGGEVDFDTGLQPRVLRYKVTQFNNAGEVIELFESAEGPPNRVVARAAVEGRTITATVPPIPGGPPDGFLAIKRVRLTLKNVSASRSGHAVHYVTTPGSCPAAGGWTNSITFTYRDNVTQTRSSLSPCTGGASGGRADRSPPRIAIGGLSRRCASRDFRAQVRIRDRSGLRRARVRMDGRFVRQTRRQRFAIRVPARRLGAGRHRLYVAARDKAGNQSRKTVHFRRC
jgi:hypothetical protein